MEEALRWVGFAAGLLLALATVIGVMKTLIVPRRAWSFLSASIGRFGYRAFYGVAARFRSFDAADRFLGFEAPTVVILTLASFLVSFTLAFGLMLLPSVDLSFGGALEESGSSVFTLGFVSSAASTPRALDIVAGATGMIFVALTIGYLPSLYLEVRQRESLVKQLEVWTGKPSWGPEILARFTLVDGLDHLPSLFAAWDGWSARVAESHMKHPVLTHFRGPRSGNHFAVALLAMADAAALDISLRPSADHVQARLLLRQAAYCLRDVAYPMRRIDDESPSPCLDRDQFDAGYRRLDSVGYPLECSADVAWATFSELRSNYASVAQQVLFWTIATPAPWSGERLGFPRLVEGPDAPSSWTMI